VAWYDPAFAADYFGTKWVGSIYGLMLTAGFCRRFWTAAYSQYPPGHREFMAAR